MDDLNRFGSLASCHGTLNGDSSSFASAPPSSMDARTGPFQRLQAISLPTSGKAESDSSWASLGFACVINASQTNEAPICWGCQTGEFLWAEDIHGSSDMSLKWLQLGWPGKLSLVSQRAEHSWTLAVDESWSHMPKQPSKVYPSSTVESGHTVHKTKRFGTICTRLGVECS